MMDNHKYQQEQGPMMENSSSNSSYNDKDNLAMRKKKKKGFPQPPVPVSPQYPPPFCSYQRFLSTRPRLDQFDENGIPYSPNPHKLWLRTCYPPLGLAVEDEGICEDDDNGTYRYRASHKDVIYEEKDTGMVYRCEQGTWVVNSKNQIVCGPGSLMVNTSRMNLIGFVPSSPPRAARNRCYSDDCMDHEDMRTVGAAEDDSGIDSDYNHLAATPLTHSDFQPLLNSTPNMKSGLPIPRDKLVWALD